MATINNGDLQDVYIYVSTVEYVINREITAINGNKSHIDKIVSESLTGIYSKKENKASDFVRNLKRTTTEAFLISLVSVFERVVFAKYKTSYGAIKTTIGSSKDTTIDFYRTREKIVGDASDKLHAIINIIDGQIDGELLRKLKIIKEYRDFIAHGKRFGAEPAVSLTLSEIATTLDKIISEIEANK